MEETKFFTKGKIIIISAIVVLIASIVLGIVLHRSNLKKEYIKFENQLRYAAPNYILKEKIVLGENEWREINIKKILSQKLVINKRANDCSGYIIAEYNSSTKKNDYNVYIKCKKIYTTKGYGTKSTNTKENNDKTQTEVDTEKPVITLFGDKEITLTVGDKYTEPGAVATDNVDGDLTKKIKITGKVNTKVVGTYEITYTVQDKSKNKSSVKRTVIVNKKEEVDDTPDSDDYDDSDDNDDSDYSDDNDDSDDYDYNDNVDDIDPIITFINPDAYQTICIGSKVDISSTGSYGYIVRDNVDGNITSRLKITGDTGIINSVGEYSLYYEVSDNAGNTSYEVRNFSAKDCTPTINKPTKTISVTSITLTPNNRTIKVGTSFKLNATINPSNATNKTIYFISSDESIATVSSDGVVTAKSKGKVRISAESVNGRKASSIITVN